MLMMALANRNIACADANLKKGVHALHHRGHVHLAFIKCHKTLCLDNIMIGIQHDYTTNTVLLVLLK